MVAAWPPKRAARRRALFEIVNAAPNVTLIVMQDARGPVTTTQPRQNQATQTQPRQKKVCMPILHDTTQSPSKSAWLRLKWHRPIGPDHARNLYPAFTERGGAYAA
jgi:hypothetical protein